MIIKVWLCKILELGVTEQRIQGNTFLGETFCKLLTYIYIERERRERKKLTFYLNECNPQLKCPEKLHIPQKLLSGHMQIKLVILVIFHKEIYKFCFVSYSVVDAMLEGDLSKYTDFYKVDKLLIASYLFMS